jgi:enamine deaminase RidA (YjgF/YER057c/UK114 family)
MDERQRISSGAPWEAIAGYSRAIRVGPSVYVAGTTAADENGEVIGKDDPFRQAIVILKKIETALQEAGATLQDVVRTRMYVTNMDNWPEIARAHGQFFAEVRPAATLVEVSRLITADFLVEVEVDAIVSPEEQS